MFRHYTKSLFHLPSFCERYSQPNNIYTVHALFQRRYFPEDLQICVPKIIVSIIIKGSHRPNLRHIDTKVIYTQWLMHSIDLQVA